ncbi:MAG TPA: AraC family transcriptional regulator [Vicinamibacterales bacterium]|nr:AraC family transcriptional regulator [Vicinamibacterales bacterium]
MVQPPKHFTSGDILRWRRVGGLTLAEVEFEPGHQIHREQNAHARFVLVLNGSLTDAGPAQSGHYTASSLLFCCADEPRSYAVGQQGARVLVVDMDSAWLARAKQHAPVLARSTVFKRGLLLHLAHRLYGEFRLRDEVSRIAIESLTLGVLAEASRRVAKAADWTTAPLWLQVALALVEQHFAEPLPLASVAKKVGVHPVHLARTFRRVYQTPFASYVRQLRIDFARRQLAGPAALSDIACAAGFYDQSHFSRSFKQHTGFTPAEYRASLR